MALRSSSRLYIRRAAETDLIRYQIIVEGRKRTRFVLLHRNILKYNHFGNTLSAAVPLEGNLTGA
jgi:hypothetical protein